MKVHWIRPVSFLTKFVDNICNQTSLPEETVLFLPMYRVLPSCGENFATLYSLSPMGKEFWCLLNRDISSWGQNFVSSPHPGMNFATIWIAYSNSGEKFRYHLCRVLSSWGDNCVVICHQVFLFWERILLAFVSSPLSLGEEFCCNCIESPPPGKIIFVRCIILYWLYQGQDSKKKNTWKTKTKTEKKKKVKNLYPHSTWSSDFRIILEMQDMFRLSSEYLV